MTVLLRADLAVPTRTVPAFRSPVPTCAPTRTATTLSVCMATQAAGHEVTTARLSREDGNAWCRGKTTRNAVEATSSSHASASTYTARLLRQPTRVYTSEGTSPTVTFRWAKPDAQPDSADFDRSTLRRAARLTLLRLPRASRCSVDSRELSDARRAKQRPSSCWHTTDPSDKERGRIGAQSSTRGRMGLKEERATEV